MAKVRPFKAIRPAPALAPRVAALPYDVMSSAEAREMVVGNPYSFLHVSRPEIDVKSMDDNGVLLVAKVYTKPEAVVADYKGIEVKKDKVRVTKDEIAADIDSRLGVDMAG